MREKSRGRASAARIGLCAAAALAAAAPFGRAAAQPDDVDPFHLGYAAMFGTGVYRLSDGTEARAVRLSLAKRLREPGVRRGADVGVRLLLPLSIAVQERDDEDLPARRPADRVEQAAFAPGVELEFPRGERWMLKVSAQAGWGTVLEGMEESVAMLAFGVRSRVTWPGVPGRPALINGLKWAGFDSDGGDFGQDDVRRGSLLRLTNAFEFDIPVPRWQFRDETMHLRPHLLGDWFYRPPDALAVGDGGYAHRATEWQIGLAAGREKAFEILGFELDGVGIAYRFSEHSEGIRLFVGSVF